MSWRDSLGKWLGGTSKPKAKTAAPKKAIAVADNPRAQLIAEARRIHRAQGTALRRAIAETLDRLARGGPTTLRDPEAAARLMELIQAQRAMGRLMGHDLRRYLVLVGMRQWLGEGKAASAPAPASKSRVVRR